MQTFCRSLVVMMLTMAWSSGTVFAAEPSGADWPQWRGPGRNNLSTSRGLSQNWNASPPKLLARIEGMGEGYASVSVVDGIAYTTGNRSDAQYVVAADLKTGKIVWAQPITEKVPEHGYKGSRSVPAIDGDRLYVVSSNGAIHCLSLDDGHSLWKRDFKDWQGRMMSGWGFSESPLVDGDRVICTPGGPNAMMVALDKGTGDEIWKSKVTLDGEAGRPGAGYGSAIISEGGGVRQYVQLIGPGLIGVRADDGAYLWGYNRIANKTANIPTAIAQGDYIFTSSGYNDGGAALLKLSSSGGGVKAEEVYYFPAKELQNHHGGMVLVGDYVYMGHGHNNGFPTCVNMLTGEVAWGIRLRGAGKGSAAVTYADGNIIYRYQSGEVALVEATPDEYRLKGVFTPEVVKEPSWAHPVVVDGKLLLREQDTLMIYDLTAGK